MVAITCVWRGDFTDDELNALHAEAFGGRRGDSAPMVWKQRLSTHSVGWVVAREDGTLVGFVNVPWDGFAHAWLQDTMVAVNAQRRGVGTRLIAVATEGANAAGCEWLHVDFDPDLRRFYFEACGFTPTDAGLIRLKR